MKYVPLWNSKNLKICVSGKEVYTLKSPFQKISIVDTKIFGRLLLLDGEIQLSTKYDAYTHESMVHPALIVHKNPRKVLILGGGDGGSSREVSKHKNVKSIDIVEIDQSVIDTSKRYLKQTEWRILVLAR